MGSELTSRKISRSNFEFMNIIGRGGFGKVWKVKFIPTQKVYSMKEMLKAKILDMKNEQNIIHEREVLSKLPSSPFISNLFFSFQDFKFLYLVLDYLPGGDLRYHLIKREISFTEPKIKFLVACIVSALEHIHSHKVIHRDVKPENLVFDQEGYLRLTDFGISKVSKGNCMEVSGTPGYMAPEVLNELSHNQVADFYSLGVIAYELFNNRRPLEGNNKETIKNLVNKKTLKIRFEKNCSFEAFDFIKGLMNSNPKKRLGAHGINEIKKHPWFKGFDWVSLQQKKMPSPFEGICKDENDEKDRKHCEKKDELSKDTITRYGHIVNKNEYVNSFFGYTFTRKEILRELYKKSKKGNKGASADLRIGTVKNKFDFPVLTKREFLPKIQYQPPKQKRKLILCPSSVLSRNASRISQTDSVSSAPAHLPKIRIDTKVKQK